jgi:hypothetical protein
MAHAIQTDHDLTFFQKLMRIQAPRIFRFPPKMLCKDKHSISIAKSNTTLQLQKEGFGNFTMRTVFQFRHELQ